MVEASAVLPPRDASLKNGAQLSPKELRDKYTWTFEDHGFQASVRPVGTRRTFKLHGKRIQIPDSTQVAYIDFLPGDMNKHDVSHRTFALAEGLQGLQGFFTKLDQIKATNSKEIPPEYFIGFTNKEMALMAKRIGFSVSKHIINFEDIKENFDQLIYGGTKTKKGGKYIVIGTLGEVRESFNQRSKKVRNLGKILERAGQQRANPDNYRSKNFFRRLFKKS